MWTKLLPIYCLVQWSRCVLVSYVVQRNSGFNSMPFVASPTTTADFSKNHITVVRFSSLSEASNLKVGFSWLFVSMGFLPDCENCGLRRECRECFPRHRLQRKLLVGRIPTFIMARAPHKPWCMSGWLTRSGGENVPGIPGLFATAILCIWQEAQEGYIWNYLKFIQSCSQASILWTVHWDSFALC